MGQEYRKPSPSEAWAANGSNVPPCSERSCYGTAPGGWSVGVHPQVGVGVSPVPGVTLEGTTDGQSTSVSGSVSGQHGSIGGTVDSEGWRVDGSAQRGGLSGGGSYSSDGAGRLEGGVGAYQEAVGWDAQGNELTHDYTLGGYGVQTRQDGAWNINTPVLSGVWGEEGFEWSEANAAFEGVDVGVKNDGDAFPETNVGFGARRGPIQAGVDVTVDHDPGGQGAGAGWMDWLTGGRLSYLDCSFQDAGEDLDGDGIREIQRKSFNPACQ